VNVLKRGVEYIYTYSDTFAEPQHGVRFGMLIKTVSGYELGGAVSHLSGSGLEFVESGQVARVKFKFRCLLGPAVYFLNAGVMGMVDSTEVFLDRQIDAAMFRVQPESDLLMTGIVDLCAEPEVSFVEAVPANDLLARTDP
jgi:lipopolysaccharide transport system ATP-binding protein